jgi:hypothetical protein
MRNTVILLLSLVSLSYCKTSSNHCNLSYISDEMNLAYNNGNSYYPSALETSECVDKKLLKQYIVDGIRYNEDESHRYIEFTGGSLDKIDTCGWRYLVVDFGQKFTFNNTQIWFLKDSLFIDNYTIECWKNNEWEAIKRFSGEIKSNNYDTISCPIVSLIDSFPKVTSSKIRIAINNCNSNFLITEFEVYYIRDN